MSVLTKEELALEVIEDLVRQFAGHSKDGLRDSMALWALADAMRFLADAGRFELTEDSGYFVTGRFLKRRIE